MAKRDKPAVTIDQVRAAAELVAKNNNCSPEEATVAQVAVILGEGSDGYVGAHLQSVKLEAARAKRLDTSTLDTQLKSALRLSFDRFYDNGLEVGRTESKVTQEIFDEVCQSNTRLEARAADLEKQLAAFELERKAEKHDHDNNMQKAQIEIMSLTSDNTSLHKSLTDVTKQLSEVNFELGSKTARVLELEEVVSEKDKVIKALNQGINDATGRCETAVKEASDQKQRADLLSMRNCDLGKDIADLKAEVAAANKRAATAEAQLAVVKGPKPPNNGRTSPALGPGKAVS